MFLPPNPRLELVYFLHNSFGLNAERLGELAGVSDRAAKDWLSGKSDLRDSTWAKFYNSVRELPCFYVLSHEKRRSRDQNKMFRLIRPADALYPLEWRSCAFVDLDCSARYFAILEHRGELVRHWTQVMLPLQGFAAVEREIGETSLDLIERLASYAS